MASGQVAIVVVAHGSRAAEANEAHLAAVGVVGDALVGAGEASIVVPAFLELAEPSIGQAIDEAVGAGAPRVVVLPHFLYPGRHLTEHVPQLVESAAGRHPDTVVELVEASGSSPRMVQLLVELARAAIGG